MQRLGAKGLVLFSSPVVAVVRFPFFFVVGRWERVRMGPKGYAHSAALSNGDQRR